MGKNHRTPQPRLGVDIGRVLIVPDDSSSDTSFLGASDSDAMATPPMPGAITGLSELITTFGPAQVWLVSKAGERIARRSERWLRHHRVFQITGLRPDHVRFCKERRDKRAIADQLGLTHFVDDRLEVLGYLKDLVPRLVLFGSQKKGFVAPTWVRWAQNWQEVPPALL